jgi:hypothetical protein
MAFLSFESIRLLPVAFSSLLYTEDARSPLRKPVLSEDIERLTKLSLFTIEDVVKGPE